MASLYDIIILYYDEKPIFWLFVCQQFFNCVETISCLLRLNKDLAADKVPHLKIEHSDSTGGESQISNPSIPNLMLYQLSRCVPPVSYKKAIERYDMMVLGQLIFKF